MTTTAQRIRDLREAFTAVDVDRTPAHYGTEVLVDAVNFATSPSALRTDREHRACHRLRRWARHRLQGRPGWREREDGRLVAEASPYARWADRP
jgi:hypothetical protein